MENSKPSSSTEKSEESQEETPPNQVQQKLDGECSNSGSTFDNGIWKYQVEDKVIPPPMHQEPPPPIIGYTNDIHNGILSGRSNDDEGLQATDPFPQSWFCPPQITFPEGGHVQTPTSERSYAAVVQGLDGSQAKQTKSEAAESPSESVQLEDTTEGSKPSSPEPPVVSCDSPEDIVGSDTNESEEMLCTMTPAPWTTLSGLEWRVPISESFQLEDSSSEDRNNSAGQFEQQATVARNAIKEILMAMGSPPIKNAIDVLQDVSTMQSPHQWGMELGGPMFATTGSKGLQNSFRGLQQFRQDFGNDDNQIDPLPPKVEQGYGSDATPQEENYPFERKQSYGHDGTSQEQNLTSESKQDYGNTSQPENLKLESEPNYEYGTSNTLGESLLPGRMQEYGNGASNTLGESLFPGRIQEFGNGASSTQEESLLPGRIQDFVNGATGHQENLSFGINPAEMELPYSHQFQQNPVYSRELNHASMFEIDERLFVDNRRIVPCVEPDQREFRLFDERQYEHNIIRSVYDVNTLNTFNPTEMCSRRLLKDSVAHWPVDLVLGSGKNMNNEHTISSVLFMNDDLMEKKPKKSEYSDLSDIKLQSLVRFISGESALESPMQFATFMGYNMNKLHMNLDTDKFITPTFAGPLADRNYTLDPSRIEVMKPFEEYMLSQLGATAEWEGNDLRRKLRFNRRKLFNYNNDLLFYMFYTFCGDALQLLAAGELYQRGWRFHKVLQVWMTPEEISFISSDGIWRTGVYKYFNHQSWACIIDTFEVNERALEVLEILTSNQPITGPSRATNVATVVTQTSVSTTEKSRFSMTYSTPPEFYTPFPSFGAIVSDPTAKFTSSQYQCTSFAELATRYKEMTATTGTSDASAAGKDPPPTPPQANPRFSASNLPTNLEDWLDYTDWFHSALLAERNRETNNDKYNSYLDCLIQCSDLLRMLVTQGRNN